MGKIHRFIAVFHNFLHLIFLCNFRIYIIPSESNAAQSALWYIPFVWLALILSYIIKGLFLQGILFVGLSALFIAGLYYLAVLLNKRFGLYEPPAITIQKSGIYAPKTGLLGKLGFSNVEAAIIRKDLRALH